MRRRAPVVAAVVVAMSMGGCATTAVPAAPAPPPGPGAGAGSGAFNPTDIAWLQLTVPMTENAVTAAHLAADHAASTAVRSAASALEPAQDGFLTRLRAARDRAGLPAGNVHSGHQMPGMITEADLVALRTSHGGDFDQRLVALLRAHAKQIVVLAKGEQAAGADPATQALARDLATAATREAEVLDRTS
ncbi:DUF305 domain-containing protein [Amycolatopsis sp. WQ 127309]|uniref:DUF305 domain-containing protein n=1 Tax=Amycolatopsis sp. WQ 127309 TaxID=2932773 RepID=UPI001FF30EE5|nr:DUF305 domain-containing protein [Amycolatopsis sp. WQ 127309]UOZ04174.1 DUF305 domain-containing protein [Amycolatopsis sp. WQ 127309]